MMKFKRSSHEEIMEKIAADIAESKRIYDALIIHDMLDDDGYPTDEALHIIESWHYSDPVGWFGFIESIWHLRSWGWSVQDEQYEPGEHLTSNRNQPVRRYYLSTAGWSGNETLLRSMKKNHMMWDFNWVQSRRGGHYIFELSDYGNQEEEDSSRG